METANKNNKWINEAVRNDIRKVFEPRYQRTLSESEIEMIADNIVSVFEEIVKFKWRLYANKQQLLPN